MRLGAGFGGQARGIVGLPGDPHLDEATLVAQCETAARTRASNGCVAVQNDANAGHDSAIPFKKSLKWHQTISGVDAQRFRPRPPLADWRPTLFSSSVSLVGPYPLILQEQALAGQASENRSKIVHKREVHLSRG